MYLIVDIDGTLVDNTQRPQHLIPEDMTKTENWTDFNNACLDDTPIQNIIDQVKRLSPLAQLTFLTSRGESARDNTIKQLNKYFLEYAWVLVMRPMDNNLSPSDYKCEWLRNEFTTTPGVPVILFDDHPDIIKMIQTEFTFITTVHVPTTCITVMDKE